MCTRVYGYNKYTSAKLMYCISGNFYVWKIMRLKIMRNQIFAIINTREINSTLKYKLRYTINNAKVNTCSDMAASSAVRVSCVSCTPVVVTML